MKRFPQKDLRIVNSELKTDLGENNFIFVGSSTDMFARNVHHEWIYRVLARCRQFKNKYLFQTKNPDIFIHFTDYFPKDTVLCTTIETNRGRYFTSPYNLSAAPTVQTRAMAMGCDYLNGFKKSVTIEPIMDFDLDEFVQMIEYVNPSGVSIGADSKGHNLPEPSWDKVDALINELKKHTSVVLKSNLERLKRV